MTYLEKCNLLRMRYQEEEKDVTVKTLKLFILSNIVGASFFNFGDKVEELPVGVPITMPCMSTKNSEYNKFFKEVTKDLGYSKIKIIANYDALNLQTFEIIKSNCLIFFLYLIFIMGLFLL